jgi:hypothetical protein
MAVPDYVTVLPDPAALAEAAADHVLAVLVDTPADRRRAR